MTKVYVVVQTCTVPCIIDAMPCLWQPSFLRLVDSQPFQVTNMGLQLVSIVLLLAGEFCQNEALSRLPIFAGLAFTADDQTYEILGKYELKDGSLSKTVN